MSEEENLNNQLNDIKTSIDYTIRDFCSLSKNREAKYKIGSLFDAILQIAEFQKQIYEQHPHLAPPAEVAKDDPVLTSAERLLCQNLSQHQLQKIDQSLLSNAKKSYRKVAMVVSMAMKTKIDDLDIPCALYSERVKLLAERGMIDSKGNLNRMRFSEIRLPI